MNTVATGVCYIVELLVCLNFYGKLLEHKHKKVLTFALSAVFYAAAFVLFLLFSNTVLNVCVFFVINSVIACIFYDCKKAKAAFCSLFLTVTMLCAEFLSMDLISVIQNKNIATYNSTVAVYAINISVSKGLYYIFSVLLVKCGFDLNSIKRIKIPAFVFLFSGSMLVTVYTFWSVLSEYNVKQSIALILDLSCGIIMLSVFSVYRFYAKSAKSFNKLYAAQTETEDIKASADYYAMLVQQNKELRRHLHDEKNHLISIRGLAADNPEVCEYIDSCMGYSFISRKTGSSFLSFLLCFRQELCGHIGVDFTANVDAEESLSFMSKRELTLFVGNILNNAIEAASKSERKKVVFAIRQQNNFLSVTCENSCDKQPQSNGKHLKSEKDGEMHGMGFEIAKDTVNKYGGKLLWTYKEKEKLFKVTAYFSNLRKTEKMLDMAKYGDD